MLASSCPVSAPGGHASDGLARAEAAVRAEWRPDNLSGDRQWLRSYVTDDKLLCIYIAPTRSASANTQQGRPAPSTRPPVADESSVSRPPFLVPRHSVRFPARDQARLDVSDLELEDYFDFVNAVNDGRSSRHAPRLTSTGTAATST
jgi:hypothetical protein